MILSAAALYASSYPSRSDHGANVAVINSRKANGLITEHVLFQGGQPNHQ